MYFYAQYSIDVNAALLISHVDSENVLNSQHYLQLYYRNKMPRTARKLQYVKHVCARLSGNITATALFCQITSTAFALVLITRFPWQSVDCTGGQGVLHNHNERTLKITKTVQCKGLSTFNSLFGFLKKSLHACHINMVKGSKAVFTGQGQFSNSVKQSRCNSGESNFCGQ